MQQRKNSHKKILIILVAFLLLGSCIIYIWIHSITNKIFIPRTSIDLAHVVSVQQALDGKSSFNILLLGYGGGNHDGTYLTDSIIVIHVDPKEKKIFLISIPRDIWIKVPTNKTGGIYSKINTAYSIGLDDKNYPYKQAQFTGADGAGRLAEHIASEVTGLTIEYFVAMDFAGFTHTIDTLDGVSISVDPAFDDYAYPVEGKENELCGVTQDGIASFSAQIATGSAQESDIFPCRFEHLHFSAGLQNMNGKTALEYVRSRHSLQDGTDFGRSQRQRNLLIAVKQKVFSTGFIPKTISFMSSLGDDLRTDLSLDDVKAAVQNAAIFNSYQVVSLALTDQNYLKNAVSSDGQDILVSKDGKDNWSSVHKWLTDTFSGKSNSADVVVEVQNGTQTQGLAGRAANILKSKNIKIFNVTTAVNQNTSKTKITVYNNVNHAALALLKNEFHVERLNYAQSDQSNYNVLVVIGNDYLQKGSK